ncbi:MAG TPA: hypothetical protein VF333_04855 [Pyrinomonadaceae bacterium]
MPSTSTISESDMSFREKGAWACLLTTVVVFVPYFAQIFRLFARDELKISLVITGFFIASIWQVLLHVVAQIVIRSKREPKDERDAIIESKSFRHAYWVFAFFGWAVIMVPALTRTGSLLAPAFISQLLFLCFVLAEVTRYSTQVVCYRRGS